LGLPDTTHFGGFLPAAMQFQGY